MILLIRHGETEWNVERRLQGRKDSPLTARGRAQADAMACLIAELVAREPHPAWRLVSSPLGRARDTAQAVADALGLPLEIDDRLAEIDCADWEGRTWDEVGAGRTDPRRNWMFEAPGGETHDDVSSRIADFLAGLPPETERRVVVVSHGVSGRILRAAYGGLDHPAMLELDSPQDAVHRLQNGQIDRFDCEPVD